MLPRFVEMEKTKGSLGRAVMSAKRPPSAGGSLFKTLASGLGTLIETLATYANVRHENVEMIERRGHAFRVRAGGELMEASNVIVATPAPGLRRALLKSSDPELAQLLAAIPYSSSAIVSMIFDEKKFDGQRAGFGFLVPPSASATGWPPARSWEPNFLIGLRTTAFCSAVFLEAPAMRRF